MGVEEHPKKAGMSAGNARQFTVSKQFFQPEQVSPIILGKAK
jgi:hypothetical protein